VLRSQSQENKKKERNTDGFIDNGILILSQSHPYNQAQSEGCKVYSLWKGKRKEACLAGKEAPRVYKHWQASHKNM